MITLPKDITQATENYDQSISIVKSRYEQGVGNGDWKKGVSNPQANQNWKEGTSKAAQEDRWKKGTEKVQNSDWQTASLEKGAAHIEDGMRAGKEKYRENFSPILTKINAVVASLPPRTTDAMGNIDKRLKPVVKAAIDASK